MQCGTARAQLGGAFPGGRASGLAAADMGRGRHFWPHRILVGRPVKRGPTEGFHGGRSCSAATSTTWAAGIGCSTTAVCPVMARNDVASM